MNSINKIAIFVTGGTIDSVFDISKDQVVVNDHSVVKDFLVRIVRPYFEIDSEVITLRDSRQITDNVRADIVDRIKREISPYILITHGTYTMTETAQYLQARHKEGMANKRIILTGSMLPLQGFAETDASYNLGFAIAALYFAKPGVYVAMNSRLFAANEALKDTKQARFVSRKSEQERLISNDGITMLKRSHKMLI